MKQKEEAKDLGCELFMNYRGRKRIYFTVGFIFSVGNI